MKQTVITTLLVLFAIIGQAQETVVWEKPVVGFSQYNYIDIQKFPVLDDADELYCCTNR